MSTSPVENRGASDSAIRHHYDVGNAFFRRWLGSTFTYSAALFEEGDDLDTAQLRKLDYHIAEAQAAGASRVLDIGCGWGSLAARLVDKYGTDKVVGLTLSKAQADWIAEENSRPNIEIRVEDWAVHTPAAPYDSIISIGAFEHFAARGISNEEKIAGYRAFFRRCHGWMRQGGRLSLQTIAYGQITEAELNSFIENDIFPESDLPRLHDVSMAAQGIFEIVRLRNDRLHYERTLRAWVDAMKRHEAELVDIAGRETFDRYLTYLTLFVIGFHTGKMDLYRMTLRRYDRISEQD